MPAHREQVVLHTRDGQRLIGELALPESGNVTGSIILLHPLPTAGGNMDSHVFAKAASRLPALAGLAVLRFNGRGTGSDLGRSTGEFGEGVSEGEDLRAALALLSERALPVPWIIGWSFGTEIILKHARGLEFAGALLLSPPLRRTSDAELAAWADDSRPLHALIPEFDHFLAPEAAAARFARVPRARITAVPGAKHLWVGESYVRRVLEEIIELAAPDTDSVSWRWDGPTERF